MSRWRERPIISDTIDVGALESQFSRPTVYALTDAYRLTSFLDAVATGSLDYALEMARKPGKPTAKTSSPLTRRATAEPPSFSGDAARLLAQSSAPKDVGAVLAEALAKLAKSTPADVAATYSGKARVRMFLELVAASDARGIKAKEREARDALEFALLEKGFPIDAATARLVAQHIAAGRSPYSHGANREWLRVHGRYGFLRDMVQAARQGLVLDAETRSALGEIARRLRASGTPASKTAEQALARTLMRLDDLRRGAAPRPRDLPPGLRANFNLDLYSAAEHAFFDAVLRAVGTTQGDRVSDWLSPEKAAAVREAAAEPAAKLPYLWDCDRLPEARRLDCDGRDPNGRLLAHMTSLASPKPASAWRLAAAKLVDDIGRDAVRRALLAWTGLLCQTKADVDDWTPIYRANALGRTMLWSRVQETVQSLASAGTLVPGTPAYEAAVLHAAETGIAKRTLADHIDEARGNPFDDMSTPHLPVGAAVLPAVRGAIWTLSLFPEDEVSQHLERIAMALLEKRHGEFRSLAAANAAIGALGAIGTASALTALKRIRHAVSDAAIAAATARALTDDGGSAEKTRSAVTRLKRP